MDEFDLIEKYFAPLSRKEKGALGLSDDAAILTPPPGKQLVATTDTIIEGVHFIGDEPGALIAKKLLRVNLSDLAAMGATPHACLLNFSLSQEVDEVWLSSFAEGFAEDQSLFNIALVGGDTVATPGPVTLSLTAFGWVEHGAALLRSGAKPGNVIFVSGTIGDATLGLATLQGKKEFPALHREHLIRRYQLPEPRIALGVALSGVAHAAIDVSDGLLQDLGHVCAASGVGAEIHANAIPRSDAAKDTDIQTLLSGGDDYELLFTAPASAQEKVLSIAQNQRVALTLIGTVSAGEGVTVLDRAGGVRLEISPAGWRHFS